ncbi:MAG: HEAT repeat domain-containing protein [Acidobacteriota bacterium]
MPTVEDLFVQLADGDQAVSFHANHVLLEKATRATKSGMEADRKSLASDLARELTATLPAEKDRQGKELPARLKHSAAVRNRILYLMSYLSTSEEVPALAEALKDLQTREAARYALERNDSKEATQTLIDALEQLGPEFRVGVVNSLSKRRSDEVLAALQRATSDRDAEVRVAAAEALANFPDAENDVFIIKAANSGSAAEKNRAYRSRLRLAETLRLAGNKAAAGQIYRAVSASDAETPQKKAAQIGLKALA